MAQPWYDGHSRRGLAICAALFALVMGVYFAEALHKQTVPFDEPLWFMRARVAPTNLSTDQYRMWAIDTLALNRWAYGAVLKSTGLDKLPPGEKRAWEARDGKLYFLGRYLPNDWKLYDPTKPDLYWFEWTHGVYAPRDAILAMRMADLAAFGALLVLLWLTARMVLGSDVMAAAAVLPLCMLPNWLTCVAFVLGGGDVFMLAGVALALYLWTKYHVAGRGASWTAVIAVGAAAGLATSAKHTGVIAVAAFGAYLFWQARGWRRVAMPAAAALAALAVFTVVNPVVLMYPGARPWQVLDKMMHWRGYVVSEAVGRVGKAGVSSIWKRDLFWLPYLPVTCAVALTLRRERWFAPLVLWSGSIVAGVSIGLARMGYFQDNYDTPVEMALYFPLSLAAMALVAKHLRAARHGEPSQDR